MHGLVESQSWLSSFHVQAILPILFSLLKTSHIDTLLAIKIKHTRLFSYQVFSENVIILNCMLQDGKKKIKFYHYSSISHKTITFLLISQRFFIIQNFRTIVFIFILIFTMFQMLCPPAFFWLKCCEYNNKNEDNNPKTLNDKNHQASSQKLRQQISQTC